LDVSRWAANPPGLAVPGVAVTASSSRTVSLAGRPEGVVDGDDRTAWSPAPDDTSPTLTLTLDEPADVRDVTVAARRGWMARHRPFVEVRLDDREEVVRASADGRLAVSGRDIRTVSIRLLPIVGGSRGAPAALEVEEILLAGSELPRPQERLSRPCGDGPELIVDAIRVPTRVDGPRSALWGEGDLTWRACGPVTWGAGTSHEIEVRGDPSLRPSSVVLTHARATVATAATALDVLARTPTLLTGTVAEGPQRLLALSMNHNDGWEASLEGRRLTPIVVDGFRQGFVVPDGGSGALDVRFAPDRPYRWVLGVGLALALLVPLTLLVPDRSRRPSAPAGDPDAGPRPAVVALLALGGAFLVAGPWASLAAGGALALLHLLGRRPSRRDAATALTVVALVTASGVLAAVTQPAHPTRPWVEAVVTLAVTAAAVLAGAGPVARPTSWRAAQRPRG
jgi:arabinofuranan 3-O-arabinosyltransferase